MSSELPQATTETTFVPPTEAEEQAEGETNPPTDPAQVPSVPTSSDPAAAPATEGTGSSPDPAAAAAEVEARLDAAVTELDAAVTAALASGVDLSPFAARLLGMQFGAAEK